MKVEMSGYKNILVAVDFSKHSEAALQQAVWLARQSAAKIVLAHTLRDLRRAVEGTSAEARIDLLRGEGEMFQREVRSHSDARMARLVEVLGANDLEISFETLLGEPFIELTHAVQAEGYDLVLAGTRGLANWQQFLVGSTARRLIRKCPAPVWIVKAEHTGPPKVVLTATDFSDVSRKAVEHGLWIARQSNADLHLLHVIDEEDIPEDIISRIPHGSSLRQEVNDEAVRRLESFLNALGVDRARVHLHLTTGTPWQEVTRLAERLSVDLISIGTVGRSGIQGVVLGNTAEQVLGACDCSVLTVKPDGFVSPIEPALWSLHPPRESHPPQPGGEPQTAP